MSGICKLLPQSCIALCLGLVLLSFAATPGEAQDTFTFDWRVIGTVNRATPGSDRHSTTRHQRTGQSTLTLLRDPTPDVRFAIDFTGPDGAGSGLVPRAAEQALDPNFAYPSPLPPGLPAPQSRAVRGSFRRLVEGPIPPAFEIVFVETFVCHGDLAMCGGVSSWEVRFIGNARSVGRSQ